MTYRLIVHPAVPATLDIDDLFRADVHVACRGEYAWACCERAFVTIVRGDAEPSETTA